MSTPRKYLSSQPCCSPSSRLIISPHLLSPHLLSPHLSLTHTLSNRMCSPGPASGSRVSSVTHNSSWPKNSKWLFESVPMAPSAPHATHRGLHSFFLQPPLSWASGRRLILRIFFLHLLGPRSPGSPSSLGWCLIPRPVAAQSGFVPGGRGELF